MVYLPLVFVPPGTLVRFENNETNAGSCVMKKEVWSKNPGYIQNVSAEPMRRVTGWKTERGSQLAGVL